MLFSKPAFRIIYAIILIAVTHSLQAQQKNYYVVIGAFAIESNAQKFTGYVRSKYWDAQYESHQKSKLFYVYILKTTQRDEAREQTVRLQKESEFTDAWVFRGILEPLTPVAKTHTPVPPVPKNDTIQSDTLLTDDTVIKDTTQHITEVPVTTPPQPSLPATVKGKLFKFIIKTNDGQPFPGEVHYVDYSRGRDLATYQAGEYVDVLPPAATNNIMSIVCGIFGYKEIVKFIDYSNPAATPEVSQDQHGAWVIPYPLERMKKGDVSVMYHVSFYKDAVVMLPGSKSEIDELVNMMKINPHYKIKIHAHCNGNHARKIIALGENKNYFDVNGSDEREGSAKELTKLRAEAIQAYLADNDIDKKRTETYPWGGSNMLVSETSNSAKLNDRIEIEILQD